MSTLVTIQATDLITNSRADINNNFSALNTDKIETSVLDTDTALTANSDAKIPSQKAVKAYVDAGGNVNASETNKGIVEEANLNETVSGTAVGATGARLFVNPSNLLTTTVHTYEYADSPVTYSKPIGLKLVFVQMWGGGGSGGAHATENGNGGGGGSYVERYFQASALGDTETITIGAGGASATGTSNGNPGGSTTFGSLLTAYGGSLGTASNGDSAGGNGGAVGNAGDTGLYGQGVSAGNGGNGHLWGGGAGGGIDDSVAAKAGGSAYWGGAGGGSADGNVVAVGAGGVSVFGGNGGTGAKDTNATAGSVPGGGGGGAHTGNSGAGGNGRVIVTEFY